MNNERSQHHSGKTDEIAPQKQGQIRPIALCVFRRGEETLVFEGYDEVDKERFFRPLGGGIEYGERSEEAAVREIREELGAEITGLRHLITLENIFTHNGLPGHEIVYVYEGELADSSIYENESISATESDGGVIKVLWKPLTDFQTGQSILYPDGLLEVFCTVVEHRHMKMQPSLERALRHREILRA